MPSRHATYVALLIFLYLYLWLFSVLLLIFLNLDILSATKVFLHKLHLLIVFTILSPSLAIHYL